jgi:hypothetical protein
MTTPHRHTTRSGRHGSDHHDSAFVPLTVSLAAFAASCAVLFGLAMSESGSRWPVAIAIPVIAAMGAVSWCLHRAHRYDARGGGVREPALPTLAAPPAITVQRFSELRTTACRHEPSGGKTFTVRCFRVDCTSPLACADDRCPAIAAHRPGLMSPRRQPDPAPTSSRMHGIGGSPDGG